MPGPRKAGSRKEAIAAARKPKEAEVSSDTAPIVAQPSAASSEDTSLALSNKNRKWVFNFYSGSSSNVPHPIGYILGNFNNAVDEKTAKKDPNEKLKLVQQSAWQVATAPGKNLFAQGFMLYMIGNSLQVVSIMFLGMAFWTPLTSITNLSTAFKKYEESKISLALYKIVYILLNFVGLGLALYKANAMGLLASTVAAPPLKEVLQFSVGGVVT